MYATELLKVQLPMPMLAAGLALWLVVVFRAINGQGRLFQFFYLALATRYLTNFFHEFTSTSLVAGQSISSIVTLSIIAAGLLFVRDELLRYKVVLPVYAFCFILLYSGMYNGYVGGAFTSILRQAMLVVMLLTFLKVLDVEAQNNTLTQRLLTIFYVPLFFQVLSLVFGISTSNEMDGATSIIGGYIHESVFSSMMLGAICIATLGPGLTWKQRTFYVTIFFLSLVVANYRTTLLAALPLVIAHFVIGSGRGVRADVALVLRSGAAILLALLAIVFFALMSERLADVGVVFSELGNLIKPPNEFGEDDRRLLSGRLLLWSDYVFTTIRSDISHILLGFGPESWSETFGLYAHNTFVSYIYEVGFIGLAVHVLVTFSFLGLAISTRHPSRGVLVGAHISYVVLSLGTMPAVQVEGIFLYAFICGFTLYYKLTEYQRTFSVLTSLKVSHGR